MSNKKNNYSENSITQRINQAIGNIVPEIMEKTGWKDQVIRRWLNGSMPGADRIAPLCKAAGISIQWLLTGEGENPENIETRNLLDKARRILTSENKVISSALTSNIYAFEATLTASQMAQEMYDENVKLKNEIARIKKTGPLLLTNGQENSQIAVFLS